MELTHLDENGAARMVDVSAKAVTERAAHAQGRFVTTPEVIALLRGEGLPKGDALAVARIAGIAGSKRTPDLVPLCHPVALHGVTVELQVLDDAVLIDATTRTADRTGVEMEALTAVAVAGTIGRSLLVTLPGSPGGVRDGIAVLAPLLEHAVSQLAGGDHRAGGGV